MSIPVQDLRRRPDVRVAERELAAATARIGEAQAYPIFDAGRVRQQVEIQNAQQEKALGAGWSSVSGKWMWASSFPGPWRACWWITTIGSKRGRCWGAPLSRANVTLGNGATKSVADQIASLGSNLIMLRPGQMPGPGRDSAGTPPQVSPSRGVGRNPPSQTLGDWATRALSPYWLAAPVATATCKIQEAILANRLWSTGRRVGNDSR
jgi:hypothetical protein